MATDLSVIMILTFALWVTSPLHELQSTAAFSQTTEKINSNWEPGVNVDLAVTMQRHHLQQLFYRYGENDSLSVEGFRKLLQNIGIDKIKRVHIHHHHDYHHILHHHHHQNHHPHSHSQRYSREELKDAGIATLAWMVIMGDGLHNFSDGLAIGAAFTEGLSSGLSTSVAVFCHELPHELGDFAVLLKAGMTVKQAVLYNALSAMLAYLGMATGIFIGHYAENVSMWIFALTAGLFMYVALVDMVPEMLHNDASDHGCSRWGYFFLQNAGILLGFGIMLLISIFEHKIVFRINF